MKNIYQLDLHESISIIKNNSTDDITRVPGGWIYKSLTRDQMNSTFVPFNNEFQS